MSEHWEEYLQLHQERFIDELIEFVSIPSVSALPQHASDVRQAGEWVRERMSAAGIENAAVMETGGHPVVYGDWLHAGPDQPTILIYGHFDVQPADPFELWTDAPFKPVIRDGRMYARGASDDKGGMMTPILAVEALLATNGKLPINVKFLFEGQEEIGSPQLARFVADHAELLACDMVYSSDGLQWSADEPCLVVALKGLCKLQIDVYGASSDLHSGLHGGGIPNPIHALSQIIASMRSADGKILVEGFYDEVVPLSAEDKAHIAAVPFDLEAYKTELGIADIYGEPGYTTRERLWARPTLELNGIWGGFQGEGSKTVIPREAHAKITCRLVADQDPQQIEAAIRAHVLRVAPAGVRIEFQNTGGGSPAYLMPLDHPGNQAAFDVLEAVYGQAPYITRLGGSIGVVPAFLQSLGAYTIMLGFSVGDENLHAPDEFFRLRNYIRGQQVYCRLLERLAKP
ncbi:MAG: dipeptidase [Anaerolineales bacterium]|nr:dipeptidase [Anaerolineales bacterium]